MPNLSVPARLLSLSLILPVLTAHGEVRPASIFADHMVLQRDRSVPVWGTADSGETVTVSFAGQTKTVTADAKGQWLIKLDPMPASAEPRAMAISSNNPKSKSQNPPLSDVLVGEVWLCSGQSNMEWALDRCTGGLEAVARAAENPELRLCTIPHNSQMTPQGDVKAQWLLPSPKTARPFSAVAWWFGSKLQKELRVPVAVINDSFGGTRIESWMSTETLAQGPWPHDQNTDVALSKAAYDLRKAKMQPVMDKYLADKAAALKGNTPPPEFPAGWPGDFRGPGVLWNGMVAPLLHLSIRGVLWYQGESNAYVKVADTYRLLLPALIKDWRAGFQQPALPFIIYQIAPNRKPQTDPNEESGIAVLQQAQLKTVQATPDTALVVTMDLGETNVHYLNKEPAGERGTKAALGLAYGRKLEYSSPTFDGMQIKGSEAVVHFANASGGLVAKGGPLSGFVIAGDDHKFIFAEAKIVGEMVVVSCAQVAHPVAVRYGWADFPKVNLFSAVGLPAAPFRSDDWPLPSSR